MFEPVVANIIPFRKKEIFMDIFGDAVSAGTGNFLTDAPKESYEVGDLAPDNVDFGVRISGDSMEPEYYNGEIAWIQQKTASAMERLVFSTSMEMPTSKNSMMNRMDYS